MLSPTRRRARPGFATACASSCATTAMSEDASTASSRSACSSMSACSHYDEFFAKVNALLTDDGVMLLHSIGHMSPPGTASPWLRKYIFPGAYSPALSEVFTAVEQASLWVTDLEFLRVHYAKTLNHWWRRFEANRAKIAQMYDERFCRMWEFYLVSAEMMFRTGSQLVFHMQLARKRDAAPIVRDYITDLQRSYPTFPTKGEK